MLVEELGVFVDMLTALSDVCEVLLGVAVVLDEGLVLWLVDLELDDGVCKLR